MSLSMYSASVPVFKRQLTGMLGWLDKAEAHAQARKFDPNNYLQTRLAPDMLPFIAQIRIASDGAKGCVARLAGIEIPKFEDNEATIDELRQRIRKTLEFIDSVGRDKIDGSEEREITIPMRNRDPIQFKGEFYLKHWALPNFFFHVTTAYALLRHNGVELGKKDFLALGDG
ncbi:DUF1993 domain-containing protein [Aquabacterium humicola]|uniref:DUF1993 domain-containing protein n=1 Tax=Aquabacterium humicola TaxID=3237377 RepID=UPI00254281DA|nr:DUF1993 domain-containing protein [Rubrivivax pictus]